MSVNTCLQVVGQTGPGSLTGPGGRDETGVNWSWELSPDQRQPGSSAGETLISSSSLGSGYIFIIFQPQQTDFYTCNTCNES